MKLIAKTFNDLIPSTSSSLKNEEKIFFQDKSLKRSYLPEYASKIGNWEIQNRRK